MASALRNEQPRAQFVNTLHLMKSNPSNRVSLIHTIRPETFEDEVMAESKIVLLLCMPHDEAFPRQQRVLEEIAGIYRERIKVVLPEEAFLEVFKNNLRVVGTPTFLILKRGREIARVWGESDRETLIQILLDATREA
ncbi:MAG: hypothetical protein EG826_11390 [Deltaproteobacteria bacterium]|nr:hypothetical protein [Deltaproteobacteria bacterium]